MARLTPQYKPRDWLQISPVLFVGHVASYTLFHWWAELTLNWGYERCLLWEIDTQTSMHSIQVAYTLLTAYMNDWHYLEKLSSFKYAI